MFTISLGNWLAKEGYDVSLMGIDYAGLKSKFLHDSYKNRQSGDDSGITIKNNNENNKNDKINNDDGNENNKEINKTRQD